jgi:hypothetical protein
MSHLRRVAFAMLISAFAGRALATDFNFEVKNECDQSYVGLAVQIYNQYTTTAYYFTDNGSANGWTEPPANIPEPALNAFDLEWTNSLGKTIGPGDTVHMGFSTVQDAVSAPIGYWIESGGTLNNLCFPSLNHYEIHTGGKQLIFGSRNKENREEPRTFTIHNALIEYYPTHQPLATLNGYTPREPFSTAVLDVPANFSDGQTFPISYSPPPGANFAVAFIAVQDSQETSETRIWSEFPVQYVPPPMMQCCRYTLILLIIIAVLLLFLLLANIYCCRRSRAVARNT